MKKIIFGLCLLFSAKFAHSQGLEDIIVEKYYISDDHDATDTDGGSLPKGSVTYRIYVDMLPGYKFQAIYGTNTAGYIHDLRFATTTLFFNNADRGSTAPNGITLSQLKKNTVMVDSWLSVGAAGSGYFGVPKSDDTDGAIGNTDGFLQNTDPLAGVPIKTTDGLIAGKPEAVTAVGIDSILNAVFADANGGPVFWTNNGSIASLNGSVGPTPDNKVLIAQITTDGAFSFELNVQIGTPTGGTENYVAKNAGASDIQFDACIYPRSKNAHPTVEITSPLNGTTFVKNTKIPITATASDSDGTVASVEFFVNGGSLGVDSIAPFQVEWTGTIGSANLTAIATDNKGAKTTSKVVNIIVSDQNSVDNLVASTALFNVYPNPTNDLLTIEFITPKQSSDNSYYAIYDVKGNRIFYKMLDAISGKYTEKIDISSLANGQYIIELAIDGERSIKKIIKN